MAMPMDREFVAQFLSPSFTFGGDVIDFQQIAVL
jgi:hypothetical protein